MNNNENLNSSENVNEGYLKEMENNNYLFNEKIKKLNNLLANANNNSNNNYENKLNRQKINRGNFDNSYKGINKSDSENDFNSKENEIMAEEILKKNYNNRDSETDFYNALLDMQKYIKENVKLFGTSREGHYEILISDYDDINNLDNGKNNENPSPDNDDE